MTVLAVTAASGVALTAAPASAHVRRQGAHDRCRSGSPAGRSTPAAATSSWATCRHATTTTRAVGSCSAHTRKARPAGPGWRDTAPVPTARSRSRSRRASPPATSSPSWATRSSRRRAAASSRCRSSTPRRSSSPRREKSIDPGQSDTVNGVLSLDGAPLAGETVQLLGAPRHHRLRADRDADDRLQRRCQLLRDTGVDAAATSSSSARPRTTPVHAVRRPSSTSGARARCRSAPAAGRHGHEVISGDLRGNGHGLRNRKVTLQSRPSGTTTWTHGATHVTRRHGLVGFRVPAPTASDDYQLVFPGGPLYDGCQSGVVTVTVA